jgi:hypothetical protein
MPRPTNVLCNFYISGVTSENRLRIRHGGLSENEAIRMNCIRRFHDLTSKHAVVKCCIYPIDGMLCDCVRAVR